MNVSRAFSLLLIVLIFGVSTSAPASRRECRTKVLGRTGPDFADVIAERTGLGKPYYPRGIEELRALNVESLAPAGLIGSPLVTRQMASSVVYLPETYEPFQCVAVSKDATAFHLKDLIGRSICFVRRRIVDGQYFYYERTRECPAYFETREPLDAETVARRNFKLPRDLDQLAQEISTKQLTHSITWANGTTDERAAIERSRFKVNRDLLRKLKDREKITRKDIEKWTEIILEATPSDDEEERRSYWVIRGTTKRFIRRGQRYLVDLTGPGFTGANIVTGRGFNAYFQGYTREEVPEQLDRTLDRLNKINRTTSYEDVVGIYRQYAFFVHPTPQGNGRVGFALLDFGMMKAGFPPTPAISPELQITLFVDDFQAAQNLLALY